MPAPRPVALVTGAAKRIGAQIARTLHQAGYDLALHFRSSSVDVTDLQETLEAARPRSTLLLQGDLVHTSRLPALVETTVTHYGRLDALINNASAFHPSPIGTTREAHWDLLFASNAKAPFFLAQAAAPHLKRVQGAILNIVDIYAERPLLNHTVYCMAKAALQMLTMSLARELGPEVRVNGIAPGAVLWPDNGKAYTDQKALIDATALRRMGHPEDVADAALFLLRDARYTTGQILRVDGGRLLAV